MTIHEAIKYTRYKIVNKIISFLYWIFMELDGEEWSAKY